MASGGIRSKPAVPPEMRARLRPIGLIRSSLKTRSEAPRQGGEGAPDAWLEVHPSVADGLAGIAVGDEIVVVTWLHQGRRDVLKVYPAIQAPSTDGRVRDAFTGSAESARPPSGDREGDRRKPAASRAH